MPKKPLTVRRPLAEPLESRRLLSTTVTDHGGALISNVHVTALYLGDAWSTNPTYESYRAQLDRFIGQLVSGPFMDELSPYGRANTPINHGSFAGDVLDT